MLTKMRSPMRPLPLLLAAVLSWGCPPGRPDSARAPKSIVTVERGALRLVIDAELGTQLLHKRGARWQRVGARARLPLFDAVLRDPKAAAASGPWRVSPTMSRRRISGRFGVAERLTLKAKRGALSLELRVDRAMRYPSTLFLSARLHNGGKTPLQLARFVQAQLRLRAAERWAFQGAALEWGRGFVFPLKKKHSSDNFLGAAGPDKTAGGGVPLNDVWSRAGGVVVGHSSPAAQSAYAPLRADASGRVTLGVERRGVTLAPGKTLASLPTFVGVHDGDFWRGVSRYRRMLADQGLRPPKSPPGAYEGIWCSWGYEFDVTVEEMTSLVLELKRLGLKWLVIDDRWFARYGDWQPRKKIYGDKAQGIKLLVRTAHEAGLKVKLWWIPLVAEAKGNDATGKPLRYPSHVYADADVVKKHPEWLILDKSGKVARGVRNLALLCPAVPAVRVYMAKLTERFINQWGADGHKLDVVFAVPPCHNPAHQHKSPMDAPRALASAMKLIFQTTERLKRGAVTEICPCGTTPHHAWLPYMNQAVTADPVGSAQVRRRVKLLKALLGPRFAVYGDHVELTLVKKRKEIGRDFAASLGTGAVIGTKFTYPAPQRKLPDQGRLTMLLTKAKRRHWARWIALFNKKQLASGEYIGGLYDVGFDRPEAHVVRKKGRLYYGFFAAQSFDGRVELRGLGPGRYRLVDYVNDKPVGEVTVTAGAAAPRLRVKFTRHLLLEAVPLSK